jgi:hypothetical protein
VTDTRIYVLRPAPHPSRKMAAAQCSILPDGWHVTFSEPTRTLEQNDTQWPYLEGFSKQKQWTVNGEACFLTRDEWKDILSAAFSRETLRIAPGLDGGVVMLGQRTSKYGKKRFSEWLEYLKAISAELGIEPIFNNENGSVS